MSARDALAGCRRLGDCWEGEGCSGDWWARLGAARIGSSSAVSAGACVAAGSAGAAVAAEVSAAPAAAEPPMGVTSMGVTSLVGGSSPRDVDASRALPFAAESRIASEACRDRLPPRLRLAAPLMGASPG